jgi:hypothetical protein
MTERKTVHESVLVGYFCQACGWIQRDIEARRPEKTGEPADRLLRAVNLSHNPLDPAVGDLILQLDDNGTLPEKFFIFELKATWTDRAAERTRWSRNWGPTQQPRSSISHDCSPTFHGRRTPISLAA